MKLRVIITGGTFDKDYDEIRGILTFKDTHLPEILSAVRCTVPVELEINQLIDSLEMRLSNRLRILQSCRECAETHILVTHGTDTMIETARLLGEAALPKTIVLTGAMVPYALSSTDAVFNLGGGIVAAQVLPPGVYVVMNGRVFPWHSVTKVKERGVFEAPQPSEPPEPRGAQS